MIVQVGPKVQFNKKELEGLSTDDKTPTLLNLTQDNIGSSFYCVDTGDYYKLNFDGTTVKWYLQ